MIIENKSIICNWMEADGSNHSTKTLIGAWYRKDMKGTGEEAENADVIIVI